MLKISSGARGINKFRDFVCNGCKSANQMNEDGTALCMAVAAIFIAQLNGVEMSFLPVISVSFTATLAAMGSAGVPPAGLILVLTSMGLPIKDVSLLLLADRIIYISELTGDMKPKETGGISCDKKAKQIDSTKLKNAPSMATIAKESSANAETVVEMPAIVKNAANAEISVEMPAIVTNSQARKPLLECRQLYPIQQTAKTSAEMPAAAN
ncbi:hypothetical protein KIN20_011243 [Parelaphostrongylus tenuis]|uniref:Amino acid transporter n=1 Tax=Parelaphostrongylus tenuis TaxID=148309 RepID=A0AAD5QLW9_PARTN|nr:hypothetical protein KIN20_011243 [Parelaphostrongylus tenuis]